MSTDRVDTAPPGVGPVRPAASKWRGIGTAALAKIVVMGLSGVLGILTSRIIIVSFGTDAYAQYGLLASLPALLPFADLGIAAVVVNAVAQSKDVHRDEVLLRSITSAFRVLLGSAAVISLVALVITLAGWWPGLLGEGLLPGGGYAAMACLALFCVALPLTVGPRVLVGLGRTTTQVSAQALTAPVIMLGVGGCALLSLPADNYLAVFTYVASAVVAAVGLGLAARHVRPQVGRAIREIPHFRRTPGVAVFNLAWPMLVQMLALPIAMQTARVLVSHLSGPQELARYNLASQLFGLALQTIAAAGVALWPVFARARADEVVESPARPTLWFIAGGLAVAGTVALASPWIVRFVSSGQITLDVVLLASFVVFVALQAAKYPLGMYMTDLAGLRFQVVPTVLMIPIAVGLSVWLIPILGAAGSVVGASVAVALCQVVPNLFYVRRDLARRRGAALEESEGSVS